MYVQAWPGGRMHKDGWCWHDKGMSISWVFNQKSCRSINTFFKKRIIALPVSVLWIVLKF